jgi:acetylornithine deacetylase/succinyl-diaminopimelate desuccinylase-like protein
MPGRRRCHGGATRCGGGANDRGRQPDRPCRAKCLRHDRLCQGQPELAQHHPGRVFFTVDFWHPEDAVLTEMDHELRQACADIAAAIGLEVAVSEFWYFPRPNLIPTVSGRCAMRLGRRATRTRTSSAAPVTTPFTWRASP